MEGEALQTDEALQIYDVVMSEIKVSKPTVSGPSQLNTKVDPTFERVKAEVKSEIMPKEMKKAKPSSRPRSTFIQDYC
jgi:hypothetical protein